MTRLLAAATGRGTSAIHFVAMVLTVLVTASYSDSRAGMRTDSFAVALLIIVAFDLGTCWLWRVVRVFVQQFLENR
jgi:ABC-type nickel/cobalt efflux system permease component RcnA